jgi:iron complex outermembrane receptor protein
VLGDYVRAKFTGGGGDVPRIQPGRFGGGLDWDNGAIDASFLVLAVSSQDHVGVADLATDGYTSVDAQVRWKPFKAKPGIELAAGRSQPRRRDDPQRHRAEQGLGLMPGRDVRLVLRSRF